MFNVKLCKNISGKLLLLSAYTNANSFYERTDVMLYRAILGLACFYRMAWDCFSVFINLSLGIVDRFFFIYYEQKNDLKKGKHEQWWSVILNGSFIALLQVSNNKDRQIDFSCSAHFTYPAFSSYTAQSSNLN